MHALPLLCNILLAIPARTIGQVREVEGIQIQKEEEKLFPFTQNTILYNAYPKEHTYTHTYTHKYKYTQLLELINKLSKVVGHKSNAQKLIIF
jgi:hypothetical protein